MKFNKILYTLTLFVITLTFYGCPPDIWKDYLRINNESADTLGVYLALGDVSAYPDTVIPLNPHIGGINPHSISGVSVPGGDILYRNIFKKRLPQDTLSVFIFNADTIVAYNWHIIRSDYKILVRYDFSFNDLKILNWTIPYPPTEAMRNMKMYPPYGSE